MPSYEVLDGTASWRVSERWTIAADVSNVLDDAHFETFGGNLLGRRALASVTYRW